MSRYIYTVSIRRMPADHMSVGQLHSRYTTSSWIDARDYVLGMIADEIMSLCIEGRIELVLGAGRGSTERNRLARQVRGLRYLHRQLNVKRYCRIAGSLFPDSSYCPDSLHCGPISRDHCATIERKG